MMKVQTPPTAKRASVDVKTDAAAPKNATALAPPSASVDGPKPTSSGTYSAAGSGPAQRAMEGHQDLKVSASDRTSSVQLATEGGSLQGATEALGHTAKTLEANGAVPDDIALVQQAQAATDRAARQLRAKAPLKMSLFQNKDGVSVKSLLGVVKRRDDVATFVPHDKNHAPFVIPAALAAGAEDGRVVRLTREGGARIQPASANATAEVAVDLESAPAGQSRPRFIGPVVVENGQAFVEDPYHAGGSIRVPLEGRAPAEGTVVDVNINAQGQAEVIGAPLAAANSAKAQMYGIFARHGLDPTFPPDVMAEVAAYQKNDGIQSGLDSGELKDFRKLPFVTIDNADSRDLDQAMYIEKHPDGSFDVFYALADASYYVKPDTALFRESMKRATSYYLPGLAIPMLPAELSEDLVSLNANKDRRAMVMKMRVGADGTAKGTTIERGVVRSRAKLAYDRTAEFHKEIEAHGGDVNATKGNLEHFGHDYTDTLLLLKEVGELRMNDAAARDVVSFHRTPVKVVTHERGASDAKDAPIFSVLADERNDVEKWNEQISLLANIEGAKFFLQHLDGTGTPNADLQAVFRVHDAPPRARIEDLHRFVRKIVKSKGLDRSVWSWNRSKESLAKYLARLPQDGDNMRITKAIHQQAMVTNVKSVFSAVAGGHHGVGTTEGYARFSSPMRELVGIFVHKEAFEALLGNPQGRSPADDAKLREKIIDIANAAKQVQGRITKEANLLAIDELFAPDLQKPVAERRVFKGTLMGVSSGKAYVQLDNPPIDVKLYLNGLDTVLGGEVRAGKDGVSLEGAFAANIGDALDVRIESYDEKSGRYNLVPVLTSTAAATH